MSILHDTIEALICNSRPAISFKIPDKDQEEFASLPESARSEVKLRLGVLAEVLHAPNLQAACIEQAAHLQRRGFSWCRIRCMAYAYRSNPDWRMLVNGSRAPELAGRKMGLPREFVPWVHDWLMLNQRGKVRQRFRALLDRLHAWRATGRQEFAIPGYAEPPADAPGADHPAGWSYARLVKLKPTRFEQTAMSIGRRTASAFRPQVYTTRVGLKVGQIVFFDDQVHDVRVNHVGNRRKVQRPLELACMDCFSAAFIAHGFKPTIWQDATETRVMLRQQDMVWFTMHWLLNIGWRQDTGTMVVAEHGTAQFADWMQAKIGELTGGKITFTAGGIDRRASFPGMFDGPARGNFRIKAGLESSFGLARNETSDMTGFPGQVGKDRNHAPEEWKARERNNELLQLASETLSPEQKEMLRYPFLEWNQFCSLALALYDRVNRRSGPGMEFWTHELEGWTAAGLLANEWRPSLESPWLPMSGLLALPAPQQAAVGFLLEGQPETLTRTRKLSPSEVWSRGRSELVRAPGYWIALILPPEYGVERKMGDNHLFEFEDQEISPNPMRYLAQIDGRFLSTHESYLTYVNPFNPSELYICDARQRYLGACPAWQTLTKGDLEAIHEQCGRAAKIEKALLLPVARAGAAIARQRAEDARHNAALLANSPAAPAPAPIAKTPVADVEAWRLAEAQAAGPLEVENIDLSAGDAPADEVEYVEM